MTEWSRSKSADPAKVWATFEGRKTINGVKRQYWIQDLTNNYKDEVLYHMSTGFLKEAPLPKYSQLADDPQSVQDIMSKWKKMLGQNLSLICLTKDENGETRLTGCNILGLLRKNEEQEIVKGKKSSMVFNLIHYIRGIKDLFSEVNTEVFLNALGLYVLPEYRGEGIGKELLKARREISRAVGLKATISVFTSKAGQNSAEMAGFKDIVVFPYENLEKVNPSFKFPGIVNEETKFLRLMYIKYND